MSIFSSKTIVYTDSVIYNLAGEEALRPNFIANAVIGTVLDPRKQDKSLGNEIVKAHINGPSIKQRQFQRWALNNFEIGTPTAEIVSGKNLSNIDLTPFVPNEDEHDIVVTSAALEDADFFQWAQQHILATRPEDISTNWTCDFDPFLNAVVIQYEDLDIETVLTPDYDKDERYIYIQYTETQTDIETEEETSLQLIYIYKMGSGTIELDDLDDDRNSLAEFMPFIPLRIWQKNIDHSDYSDIFPDCKKAYRKLTGKNIENILEEISDNEDIEDVDFAYLNFGVPLNTADNDSRIYIYEFFKKMIPYQEWGEIEYQDWRTEKDDNSNLGEHPPVNRIQLSSEHALLSSYDMRLNWITIDETIHSGLGKPEAKRGDCWFVSQPNETYDTLWFGTNEFNNIFLIHQVSETSYRRLKLRGLMHQNNVYNGNMVSIQPEEALADSEESGFLVPIHYPTLREVSLKVGTQMAIGNTVIVFNSYAVVKRRWYQRGIFRVIFAVVLAVIAAFVFPGAIGLLGANMAVGASLGFSGMAAVIAGSVVNTIAAIVLMTAIEMGAVALFGEKLGAIIGAIASFFTFQFVMNFQVTGSMNFDWGSMFRAENLIKLTDSVAAATANWAKPELGRIGEDTIDLTNWYDKEVDKIEKMTMDILGYSGAFINPLILTQTDNSAFRAESSSSFLARTLLTGSDIADVSHRVITNFAEISLKLPDYTA